MPAHPCIECGRPVSDTLGISSVTGTSEHAVVCPHCRKPAWGVACHLCGTKRRLGDLRLFPASGFGYCPSCFENFVESYYQPKLACPSCGEDLSRHFTALDLVTAGRQTSCPKCGHQNVFSTFHKPCSKCCLPIYGALGHRVRSVGGQDWDAYYHDPQCSQALGPSATTPTHLPLIHAIQGLLRSLGRGGCLVKPVLFVFALAAFAEVNPGQVIKARDASTWHFLFVASGVFLAAALGVVLLDTLLEKLNRRG